MPQLETMLSVTGCNLYRGRADMGDLVHNEPDVLALQEVFPNTFDKRILEDKGYEVVLPNSNMDLALAVGGVARVLEVIEKPVPPEITGPQSRPKWRRDLGVLAALVETSMGDQVLVSTAHNPTPAKILPRKAMFDWQHGVMSEMSYKFPKAAHVHEADHNGASKGQVSRYNQRQHDSWGGKAVLPRGLATFKFLNWQLDGAHVRPPHGYELVRLAEDGPFDLNHDQMGYSYRLRSVKGADHDAVEVILAAAR